MSTPTPVAALSKEKHIIIVALLTAAGTFLSSLITGGVVAPSIGGPIGAILGELLIYEHSA